PPDADRGPPNRHREVAAKPSATPTRGRPVPPVLASPAVQTRLARPSDAIAMARIYNEGIEDRLATFETRLRTGADVERWIGGRYPVVVVESDGAVIGWASASSYRPGRDAYAGVAEFSVYVGREARGHGAGRAAMVALIDACEKGGFWRLVSRIFAENTASLALCRASGFRQVGT